MNLLNVVRQLQELDAATTEETEEVLTAEILSQLKRMSVYQLEAIYKSGRRKVRIDNTPEAYAILQKMSMYQLEAIFGKR